MQDDRENRASAPAAQAVEHPARRQAVKGFAVALAGLAAGQSAGAAPARHTFNQGSELMQAIEKLQAIEEIRQLKARYFRAIDTKDWTLLDEIFCDDGVFDVRAGRSADAAAQSQTPAAKDPRVFEGSAAIGQFIRTALENAVSIHHGHGHEIELLSSTEARGVIAMEDIVTRTPAAGVKTSMHGWGHYHEHYRKVDGRWRIQRSRITRLALEFS